jgi:hypothetical protein
MARVRSPGFFFEPEFRRDQMSKWLVWLGCGLVGIGLIPTLTDYLPVDLWDWLMDPMGRTYSGPYRIIPAETGTGYSGDAFVGIGLVVLIAGMIVKRYGR